ncbi:hypothetical protein [Aliarcobacter skirrowii]|uniref:Uncharacterized protein n=1 Tax=Aliarcobacter skirrowii TaxID=28200 RepID=A0AAW9DA93_9BACT|nr:hypothetical protein [Aliarcobacter skirrowii]MDX4069237.1 hypothetical protein [Aliarcobacter skirrowii]
MKRFTLKISFCNAHAHIISITTIEANEIDEAKAKCFKKFSNRTINKIEVLKID